MKCRLVSYAISLFLAFNCFSQKTWTGSNGSSWNDANNWSPSGIPGSGDDVIINSGSVNLSTTPVGDIGSLTINGGTLTVFSSLSLTLGAASTVASGGVLVNSGTLTLNGDLVVDGQLDFGSGLIQGAGDLTINGTFNWTNSAAVITGSGTRTNNATTNIQGALLQTVFVNDGTVNQSGTQTFILGDGGRYENNGTHDFQNDRDINENHGGNLGMINTGSMIKSGGDLASGRSDILVTYSGGGSIEAQVGNIDFRETSTQSGTITSQTGGAVRFPTNTHTFDGASIGGTGYTHFNGGTISIPANLTATNIEFSSGSASGTGDLTITNDLNWTGGTIGNQVDAGQLITSATVTLNGGDRLETTWQNNGTLTWSGGSFTLNTNGILINNGTFDIQTDQDIFTLGSPQSIQNVGTIEKTSGSSTTIFYPDFTNSGIVDVQTGTLRIRGGSNTGQIVPSAGGTVDISSQTFTNEVGGTLGGVGNITVGASLVNEGSIGPGTSPGILTITETGGAFSLASTSQVAIELGGTTVGTEHDQLVVSGTFDLNGTLNASLINSFVPNPADTFDVLDYTSITGSFTNTTAADLDSLLIQIIDHEGSIKFILNYQEEVASSICDGESIFLEGANQTTAGIYRDTLTASIGIDSIVITTLSIHPLPTVTASASATSIQEGASVTLNGSGAVSYVWDNGVIDGVAFMPIATTTYTVTGTDANGCMDTDMITVTVNNPPTVNQMIADQQAMEDQLFSFVFDENTFSDPNEDALTYTATLSDDTALPAWLSFTPSTRTFSGTPTMSDVGTLRVKVTATDPGTLAIADQFDLAIIEVNDPPVLGTIGDKEGDELSELSFTASATDPEGNSLTYTLDAASLSFGMAIGSSSGVFQWTPAEDEDGIYTVVITVSDGTLEDDETITITIDEVNEPPTLTAVGNQTVNEGELLELTIMGSDPDFPENTLAYSLDASSDGKGMSIGATSGAFSWTPQAADIGTHEVTVSLSDGITSTSMDFSIVVENVLGAGKPEYPIKMYPNPFIDSFAIRVPKGLKIRRINILNLSGQRIFDQPVYNHEQEVMLKIDHVPSGFYQVQIVDENNTVTQLPLIKR